MASNKGGERPLDKGTQQQITRKVDDQVVKKTTVPRPNREADKPS